MARGALDLGPTIGALSFLGQVNAQNRARAERRRGQRANTFGALTSLAAGGAALALAPPLAPLAFAGGGLVGRAAAGGEATPADVVNLGIAGLQTGQLSTQANQVGAERGALNNLIQQAQTQQVNPADVGSADDFGIGNSPEAVQGQRIQNIQGALSAGAGSPTPFATARGALQLDSQIRGALNGPVSEFGFTNVPDVGLVRTNTQAGTAETVIPVSQTPKLSPKAAFKRANDLRDEYVAQSGDFVKIRDSFNRVRAVAADPSAAGDLALLFNYMKILDPGSVVRESEFATAENSAGVPERIRARYNKLLQGERLSPKTRADFVKQATNLYNAQLKSQRGLISEYTGLANRAGIPKEDVVLNLIGNSAAAEESLKTAASQPAGDSGSVRTMAAPELLKFLENPELTTEQKKEALARLRELNAQ